ncbi:hypothetical protein HMPREF9997_02027 [Corynebacterium durum F0235]|uniref:Uncharacterized protein n=1 Tax=Corynebacterium durum F0235 TaxID=1035195 RepID=L1MCS4_9CORY|nr:hypothetical protein HMPREF9997_02027 [Corynebacterium durum F0235]
MTIMHITRGAQLACHRLRLHTSNNNAASAGMPTRTCWFERREEERLTNQKE